ncbi:MAG: AAA family ATPase [Planctomycetota bacterium]
MMLTDPQRFSQLRWLNAVVGVFGILVGVVLIVYGIVGTGSSPQGWMLAAGGFVLFIAIMLMAFSALVVKMESTTSRQLSELRRLKEAVQQALPTLDAIAENTRISDAAKSLAHRDREMDAVRKAIRDDIQAERWESGISLAAEIERRFGYKEEAEAIREELEEARGRAIQAKLGKAIEKIEAHFAEHDWERAEGEIERLGRALPRNAQVARLPALMAERKEQHKEELKAGWNEAVRRSDTDRAIDILRGLDQYLSSAEVHELQNSARNVFKDKLLQLGVQFRFAVTERRWQDALDVGLQLVKSFPNARMANEVREALDVLRQRVAQEDDTSVETAESKQ